MKRILTLAVLSLTLAACGTTAGGFSGFVNNAGIPVVGHADIVAVHAILQQRIATGNAGPKVLHADSCAVAWLAHPELQGGIAPTATTPAPPPIPPTAGVLSGAAALLVQADAGTGSIQSKVVLVEAGLPDDIITGCALFVHDFTPTGVLAAWNRFIHPQAAPLHGGAQK